MKVVLSNGTRGWWGTAEMTRKLARGFLARGHEVTIFCRGGTDVHEGLRDAAPCEPILSGAEANPAALWRCRRALQRLKPDVVIAHTDKDIRATGLVARLMGIPVILREETDRPLKDRLRYRLYYGWVPDHHIAVSHATVRTLCDSVSWIDRAKMSVIPNGIDTAVYTDAEPVDLGLPSGSLAVGFVGRFEERKGIFDLARAWPRVAEALPHAHLVIAGSGEAEAKFREALAGAPRVRWLGFRNDVPRIMAALDVLAFPSHWEGFGLALVEAMLALTPVVACDTSNIPEIVTDGVEGRLVKPEAPEMLADALIELGRDPERRAQMARAGRARALRDYSVELMLDRHEALLGRIIAHHHSGTSAVPTSARSLSESLHAMRRAGPKRRDPAPDRLIEYFEQYYREQAEPWDYSQRAAEVLRHDFVRELAATARPSYRRALDIGCSLGQLTGRLAGLAPEIHGIDISSTAVVRARAHCAAVAASAPSAGVRSEFHFAVGSAARLPYPDASFDLIFLCDGLFSWKLPAELLRQALEETHRLLAPGGVAILTDYMKPSDSERFFGVVKASPLRVLSRYQMHDRYWYRLEGWLRPMRQLGIVRRLLASRCVARAIMAASRPLGRYGTKHFGMLATR